MAVISFVYLACFCVDAVVLTPLCLWQILLLWFLCWALAPFFVWFAVFLTKRKSGWEICGSSGWLGCSLFRYGFAFSHVTTSCPYANSIFSSCLFSCYSSVRTSLRATSAKPEKKKWHIDGVCWTGTGLCQFSLLQPNSAEEG